MRKLAIQRETKEVHSKGETKDIKIEQIKKMPTQLIYALISVIIVSLISLIGITTLTLKKSRLERILIFFIGFSVGALLGDSFIHLLPEAYETTKPLTIALSLLSGILIFFILEKFICWRHCHIQTSKGHKHPFVYMNLVGDGLHNFIDGALIAASFIVSVPIGIATSIAVILHEIPQEISDFGVLVYGGFKPKKALFFNFLSALTAVLGVIIVFAIGRFNESLINLLIPLTAGGFLYIALSDLTPELHKHTEIKHSILQVISIILGIAVMLLLLLLE